MKMLLVALVVVVLNVPALVDRQGSRADVYAFAEGFTKATNYMSAKGYQRWQTFQQTKTWR